MVVLTSVQRTCLCRYERTAHAPNWVAERLGASSRRPRHPFPALMAGVNPGPVPVHRALQAHPQPSEMHLRHPIEQAEHLHDIHDLWHDATISSTPRERQPRDIAVFLHAEPLGICRCTQQACERPCPSTNTKSCNCGIATVFSMRICRAKLQGHRPQCQRTGESPWFSEKKKTGPWGSASA